MKAYLILEDGTVFTGTSIGSTKDTISEAVFNTSMAGCQGLLFDPLFVGKTLVMTYPLAGQLDFSTYTGKEKIWPDGIIVRKVSNYPINGKDTLDEFLKIHDIPGITNIDTRALTKHLRDKGTMNCLITTNNNFNLNSIIPILKNFKFTDAVKKTTCEDIYSIAGKDKKIALLNLGVSKSISNSLLKYKVGINVYPAFTKAETILLDKVDAVVISDGPGSPLECQNIVKEIQKLIQNNIPILALGLGHDLVFLAKGGKLNKMKFGHRGINYPVKDLESERVYITVQNHGYTVDESSLKDAGAEITFLNVNDKTVAGLKYKDSNIMTVQFQPETTYGPKDTKFVYDRFMEMTGGRK